MNYENPSGHSNYLQKLTDSIDISALRKIKEIIASIDYLGVSVLFDKADTRQFLKGMRTNFKETNSTPEAFSNSKAMSGLFKKRTYFDLGGTCYMMVFTEKARAIDNFHAFILIYNPGPKHLRRFEKRFGKIAGIESFWLSGIEYTFDFIMKKLKYRRKLQKLFKQTLYFSYGGVAFKQGEAPLITDYLNSRKSVKQIRAYLKDDIEINKTYLSSFRFEFKVKREKMKREGVLIKPTDILRNDLDILNEIKFFEIDPHTVNRSLFDYNCDHYFSYKLAKNYSTKGFHQTQVWARKDVKGCPNNCDYRDTGYCKKILNNKSSNSPKQRYRSINRCKHSQPLINFRRDFNDELESFNLLKKRMIESFETWKDS
jgi:hypothetical protein